MSADRWSGADAVGRARSPDAPRAGPGPAKGDAPQTLTSRGRSRPRLLALTVARSRAALGARATALGAGGGVDVVGSPRRPTSSRRRRRTRRTASRSTSSSARGSRSTRRSGRRTARPSRSATCSTRRAADDPDVQLLRLPDAVQPAAQRADRGAAGAATPTGRRDDQAAPVAFRLGTQFRIVTIDLEPNESLDKLAQDARPLHRAVARGAARRGARGLDVPRRRDARAMTRRFVASPTRSASSTCTSRSARSGRTPPR